ncbi:MAG: hypothetical protein ACXAC5_00840 [Promethearchaeota archaeon]|jgi:hypothetical protein
MKLSIFLAGIRTGEWAALYNSIPRSTSLTDYEFIIVSPYGLPPELEGKENVKLIKDFGSPSRCYQIGLLHSQGEYAVWAGDDGTFSPTLAIDKALASIPKHKKGVVTFPYSEGHAGQSDEAWWHLGYHKLLRSCEFIPRHYFLIMSGLIRRDYLMEIGGFDCRFEHSALPCVDLSVRLQRDGAEVIFGEKIQDLALQVGTSGDHEPIKQAHRHDKEVLLTIYSNSDSISRAKVPVDNWKNAQEVWVRRFKGEL